MVAKNGYSLTVYQQGDSSAKYIFTMEYYVTV